MKYFSFISLQILTVFLSNTLSAIVQVKQGLVSGTTHTLRNGKVIDRFIHIPYALPPVGEKRFKVRLCKFYVGIPSLLFYNLTGVTYSLRAAPVREKWFKVRLSNFHGGIPSLLFYNLTGDAKYCKIFTLQKTFLAWVFIVEQIENSTEMSKSQGVTTCLALSPL